MEVAETDDRLIELANRRAAGEPLQYLTGTAAFRYLELAVGSGVLVPRPETESVAELAMNLLPEGGRIVDVGTGSGAIGLAVADERPDADVWATDISDEALVWAERNRQALGKSVQIVKADLFDGLEPALRGTFDVIVSNPPYIGPEERESLPVDVVDHEPEVALFADGGGTSIIQRLANEGAGWLKLGGSMVLEIGATQGEEVASILEEAGYQDVRVHPDLSGLPRVAVGRLGS
jgi:release factor glutamine methyltransferase